MSLFLFVWLVSLFVNYFAPMDSLSLLGIEEEFGFYYNHQIIVQLIFGCFLMTFGTYLGYPVISYNSRAKGPWEEIAMWLLYSSCYLLL